MIYITSDWHFSHDKPFIYEPRGFKSVEEMNAEIVKRHNEIVKKDDIVYVLGDCCLGGASKEALKYNKSLIESLNGNLFIIGGNHCSDQRIEMYESCKNVNFIGFANRFNYGKKQYFLCHYPAIPTNQSGKPVWCLHGHTHSKDKFSTDYPNCYNCALDAHDCKPVSLEEIAKDIANKIV